MFPLCLACGLLPVGIALVLFRLRARRWQASESRLSSRVEQLARDLGVAREAIERLSLTDSLTRLPGRRHFELILAQEWKCCSRESHPLSLLMLDVDGLQPYNDACGRPAGDECIGLIAACIQRRTFRAGDFVARLSGGTFVVLLPNTPPTGAVLIAERQRSGVEETAIPHRDGAAGAVVTVSIGVATMVPDQKTQSDRLVSLAGQALAQAKKFGRNCYQLAGG